MTAPEQTPAPELAHLGGDVQVHPGVLAPEVVATDSIRPHPDNPRNGDTDVIAESIGENALYRAILVQRSTGYILAGNHTYAAAIERGADRIPAVLVDVDDDRARKIMLADNRTADMGRYDEAQLLEVLAALEGDLVGTGYTGEDVDNITALLASGEWGDGDGRGGAGAGEPDEESFNPRIDLRVTARVFDAWRLMLDAQDGADDAAKLEAHLTANGYLS
jgi:hypothetical protein